MADTLGSDASDTRKPDTAHTPASPTSSPAQTTTFSPKPTAWNVMLAIGAEPPHLVRVEIRGQLTIGFTDPITGFVPDLDLTAYGAAEARVSHRHAIIHAALGGLHIQDWGSRTGIILNSLELDPNKLHKLQEGDILELGQLRIVVQSARIASTFGLPGEIAAPSPAAGKPDASDLPRTAIGRVIERLQNPPDARNESAEPPIRTEEGVSITYQAPDAAPVAPSDAPAFDAPSLESLQPDTLRPDDMQVDETQPDTSQVEVFDKRKTQLHRFEDIHFKSASPAADPSHTPDLSLAYSRKLAAWDITFAIGTTNPQIVRVAVKGQLTIGYAEPALHFVPDLDLTPYGAKEAGVSHRHAIIHAALGGVHIRDLDSEHGITLNGLVLDPKKLHKLREGDVLELGQLRIVLQAAQLEGAVETAALTRPSAPPQEEKPDQPLISAKSLRKAIEHLRNLPLGRDRAKGTAAPLKSDAAAPVDPAIEKRQTHTRLAVIHPEAPLDVIQTPDKKPVLWSVILAIGSGTPQMVRADIKDKLTIGYADAGNGSALDLDLAKFGAQEARVSQRHAVFQIEQGNLLVRDLGSVHGTLLNGVILDPRKLYKLHEGDVLELGRLRIVLQTIRQTKAVSRTSESRPAVRLEPTPPTRPVPQVDMPPKSGPIRVLPGAEESLPEPKLEALSDWSLQHEVFKRQTQEMMLDDGALPQQAPQPWVVRKDRKSGPVQTVRQPMNGAQRQTITIAAVVIIGVLLLTAVGLSAANQPVSTPKPTAQPESAASASDAFSYFRKVGLPISNFQMLNTPNTTWKAKEEIRFDIRFGDSESSMLVLSYDTSAQASADATSVAQQETLKRMRVTQVSNFLLVAFPDIPQAINTDLINHLKQYVALFAPPSTATRAKK